MSDDTASAVRETDSTLLRFVAVLLIANSHLEAFYPRRWLAGDGLLGNSLFFVASGCGLMLGTRAVRHTFPVWYSRRLLRIYPTLFVFVVVMQLLIDGEYRRWGLHEYATQLLWPTNYGFIELIVPFYVAFYVVMTFMRERAYLAVMASLFGALTWLYLLDASRLPADAKLSLGTIDRTIYVVFDFWLMLLGGYMGMRSESLRGKLARDGTIVALLTASYVALKYFMVARGTGSRAYGLLFVLAAVLSFFLFRLLQSAQLTRLAHGSSGWSATLRWLGASTLEVYVVHVWVMHLPWIASARFPWNVVAFWAGTYALAYALVLVSGWLRVRILRVLDWRPREPNAG